MHLKQFNYYNFSLLWQIEFKDLTLKKATLSSFFFFHFNNGYLVIKTVQ